MNDAPDAALDDGPSAHGPLPRPDLEAPEDLADGVGSDDPAVVVDAVAPESDQINGGDSQDGRPPVGDLADGGPPHGAAVVRDDVAADHEEQEAHAAMGGLKKQ